MAGLEFLNRDLKRLMLKVQFNCNREPSITRCQDCGMTAKASSSLEYSGREPR